MAAETHTPLVSVIVPVYNAERYVREAVQSVLAQTYRPIEVIVVNDGSSDGTAACLAAFGPAIQALEQANQGVSVALNSGLARAAGELIAILDADDLWTAEKLALQVACLNSHAEIAMVFGYVQQFISPELDETLKRTLRCPANPEPGNSKITMLARRNVFEKTGGFNPDYRVGDFLDWYLRAEEAGFKSQMLNEVLALRRVHKSHTTDRSPESTKSYVYALKAVLDRRRAAQGDGSGK